MLQHTFYHFRGNSCSYWLWWQQHVLKKMEQGDVYRCVALALLLTPACKRLWSQQTSWGFRRNGLVWCRNLAASLPDFFFHDGERSERQTKVQLSIFLSSLHLSNSTLLCWGRINKSTSKQMHFLLLLSTSHGRWCHYVARNSSLVMEWEVSPFSCLFHNSGGEKKRGSEFTHVWKIAVAYAYGHREKVETFRVLWHHTEPTL